MPWVLVVSCLCKLNLDARHLGTAFLRMYQGKVCATCINLQHARWHFFPNRTIMVDWALNSHQGDCYSGWIRSGLLLALLFDSLGPFRMGAQGLVLFQITEGSVLVFRVPVDQVFTVVDVLLMMADVLGGGLYRRPTTWRDVTPSATVVWYRSAQWAWSRPRMARGWSSSPGRSEVSTKNQQLVRCTGC